MGSAANANANAACSRPTIYVACESNQLRGAESVFYFISELQNTYKRASSKRLTVANHMLNLLIIREVSLSIWASLSPSGRRLRFTFILMHRAHTTYANSSAARTIITIT